MDTPGFTPSLFDQAELCTGVAKIAHPVKALGRASHRAKKLYVHVKAANTHFGSRRLGLTAQHAKCLKGHSAACSSPSLCYPGRAVKG